MRYQSPKHNFLQRNSDDDQDLSTENLIHVKRDEYKPGSVAASVHASLSRTKIMRGGLGSGKTRCAGEHINAINLNYPGAFTVIGRKDLTDLKNTTQKEFLEFVVAPETIETFNVNENMLYYKNGSMTLFAEAKTPDSFKSMQIAAYMIDEADELPTNEIWDKLDDRLRQKITIDGELVQVPYCGLLVFNPTHEEHWLYDLAHRTDIDVQDFRFSTYDNAHNLPPDYIPNLIKKLAPWDVRRLVEGHWGRSVKGKPVYHGFTMENHVKPQKVNEMLPLLRGWDFGFNHPAVKWVQIDPKTGRTHHLREFLGRNMYLSDVVEEVNRITRQLVGGNYPTFDYGDPHGNDRKDNAESSIEYLRVHKGIHVLTRRSEIKTGADQIQHKIITQGPLTQEPSKAMDDRKEPLMMVDPSCKITIAAYLGGYHRDESGQAVKDGYYDHIADVDRYIEVNNMGSGLIDRFRRKPVYRPKNKFTGY